MSASKETTMGHPPEEDWKHAPGASKRPEQEKAEEQDSTVRFKVNGREYVMADVSDLDFEEQELIEDAFNLPLEDIDFRRAKALRWLIFVSMRRAGVQVTFDDLKSIKGSDISDAEERPTEEPAPS
jgi:hypothetical protein